MPCPPPPDFSARHRRISLRATAGLLCAPPPDFSPELISGDLGPHLTTGDMSFQTRCSSMHIPDPVISLSIRPAKKGYSKQFNKALNKF